MITVTSIPLPAHFGNIYHVQLITIRWRHHTEYIVQFLLSSIIERGISIRQWCVTDTLIYCCFQTNAEQRTSMCFFP